jgi:hypothetical protein
MGLRTIIGAGILSLTVLAPAMAQEKGETTRKTATAVMTVGNETYDVTVRDFVDPWNKREQCPYAVHRAVEISPRSGKPYKITAEDSCIDTTIDKLEVYEGSRKQLSEKERANATDLVWKGIRQALHHSTTVTGEALYHMTEAEKKQSWRVGDRIVEVTEYWPSERDNCAKDREIFIINAKQSANGGYVELQVQDYCATGKLEKFLYTFREPTAAEAEHPESANPPIACSYGARVPGVKPCTAAEADRAKEIFQKSYVKKR